MPGLMSFTDGNSSLAVCGAFTLFNAWTEQDKELYKSLSQQINANQFTSAVAGKENLELLTFAMLVTSLERMRHTLEHVSKERQVISAVDGLVFTVMSMDQQSAGYLNKPSAPFASVIGNHSVTLGWKAANISGVKYVIQWKFNKLPGDWRYTEVVSATSFTVKDLQAFTEYVFQVVWIITSQLQLHSPPSPSYRTHAFGVPATAPVIKDIQSSSPNTVEVSWSPPLFPNGLIIGYNLLLTSENHELLRASRGHSFQFYSTFPNTTYRFSIVAVNEVGAGPPAEANITTPASKVKEKGSWLFLSRKESLRKRYRGHFLEAAQCLPDGIIHHNITGISVNIYQEVVYFSEGNSIWVKSIANMSDVSDLMLFYAGWGNILSISVDWLYQRIYFVMNEKIHVCHLENCTVAEDITPLYVMSPRKVIADPYNGYIFCLLEDGIYRANLPLLPGTASASSLVVRSNALRTFTIDFQSKRLIFFNKTEQAFVSGFLDGSEFHTLRSHVPFNDMESFVYKDNTFTVTDGSAVFHEEVSPVGSSSFNEYIVDCNLEYPEYFGIGNLVFYGPSTQPFPLPTVPRLVTALFGSDRAVISWRPPEHSIGTSLSAWQNWTYDVQVSSHHPFEEDWVVSNISNTRLIVKWLASFTAYEVSVRAVSPAGAGPWSESFRAEEEPYILAVGPEGLWKQRLDSYRQGELLYPHIRNVSDLDWYNNTLYWINSMGEVQTWTLNKRKGINENTYVSDVRNARMLAFDWLGQCLYWAGKANTVQKRQIKHVINSFVGFNIVKINEDSENGGCPVDLSQEIYRKSLWGGHIDVVAHVVFPVKDLVVDSINGYLYWATMYSVESTRLNGEEYLMLQEQLQFSGKQALESEGCLHPHNLTVPSYRVDWLEPFALFDFTVTPYTYWGKAPMTSVSLRAPEGVPSAPRNPRIYVLQNSLHGSDGKVLVEFRWDRPERDNGILMQFSVYYQIVNQSSTAGTFMEWIESNVKPTQMQFSLKDVLPSLTVQAFTSVGPGPMSDMAEKNSSDIFPIPTLITISANKLFLTDIDSGHTKWELSAKTNFFKDVHLHNVTAITVDWIARHLFVALKTPQNETQIFLIDLELKEKSLKALNKQLSKSNSTVSSLLSYPFLSRLYWMEEFDNGSHMFYYDILNNTMQHILGHSLVEKTRNYCTCNVTEAELGRPMSIDLSDSKNPQLLFIRGGDEIWASDVDGCHCWRTIKIPSIQDKRCLILLPDIEKPTILAMTNTSFTLSLPSVMPQQLCPGISQPTPTYLEYQGPVAVLDNLQPFSSYAIQIAVKNYYSDEEVLPVGEGTVGTTLYGVPEAVNTIKTLVLSDTTINISWSEPLKPNGPLESIRYQISVNLLPPVPVTPLRKNEFSNGMLAWSVSGLQSGTNHSFKVLAFHPDENWFSESVPVIAKTFETPAAPINIVPRNISFQLEWRAPLHISETSFWFELCKWPTKSDWFSPANTTCIGNLVYKCNLTGTQPWTNYFVRVTVVYVTGVKSTSSSTSFKTTVGVPSKPGVPKRAEDSKNSLQWEKADDNGSKLTYYILESRKQSGNSSDVKSTWEVVYNGSCGSICTWKAKNLKGTFQFRAAAANVLGLGEYSDISMDIVLSEDNMMPMGIIIAIASVVGVVVLCLAVVMLLGFVWKKRLKSRKPALPGQIVFIEEDKELAQLRGMAETVGLANACYAIRTLPSQAEIESLPAFPRNKLNLHKLLGSGAFGEVYEGTAVDILADGSGESKVAVKLQSPLLRVTDLLDICLDVCKGCVYLEKMHFIHRCDLMTRCWSQEPHNRPTFSYIHDKLQEIRHSPLSFIHCLEDKEESIGVINEAFEGSFGDSHIGNSLQETGWKHLFDLANAFPDIRQLGIKQLERLLAFMT
ncbi:Proto-oncogene tyrosine-protein kinase ROS [Lonchura striata]|uniref:Proto-oncogene tyrosine-protein kinase ROS n=1 Tax=Lonchura striata TaxID=40157 RepID=A0A218UXP7_9PASE|nr:Proto-oncogene tyrosine-protein kinase ROS [Lonchura striata domestica]